MWNIILKLLLKFATSKVAEELIGVGINKLLASKDSGIGKDLANTMINGIVKSKKNNIDKSIVAPALSKLGK